MPLSDLWGVIADSIVGRLLAGENLIIMGTDAAGKKTLFRVDGSGMYAYNSRFWMESANGGAFAIDPSFGLGLGQGNPFTVGSDGTIVPKCIDPKTGELKLDKDGFPVGMNFWAGMDGSLYIKGNIYATDGVFNGTVYAKDGEFSGKLKAAVLDGKLTGNAGSSVDLSDVDYIDLGGMILDGRPGSTGIRFRPGYNPIQTRYSTNKNATIPGGWSTTWNSGWTGSTTTEVWAIHSYDGGATWTSPMLTQGKTGTNGKPGSDASVTRANIVRAMLDAIKEDGLYVVTIDDKQCLGINASAIKTGTLDAIEIHGCNITADSVINVGTDAHVGNEIRLGKVRESGKAIIFSDKASISNPSGTEALELNAQGNIILKTTSKLDLGGVADINWGKNAPVAVFG